jgi:hypothetical protein
VDEKGFEALLHEQKERSRKDAMKEPAPGGICWTTTVRVYRVRHTEATVK